MTLAFNSVLPTVTRISRWALSAALLCAGAAQAQMSVSPLVIEAQANRGQAQAIINVTNTSNQPFRGRVYAESFTYGDNGFKS
jgi:P pilus assembly chaperone PapD